MKKQTSFLMTALLFTSGCSSSTGPDEDLVKQAKTLKKQGQKQKAIEKYRAALAINPKNFEANFHLGFELFQEGKLDSAMRKFAQAAELQPNNKQAVFNLGMSLFMQEKIDQAISCLKKAIELDQHYTKAQLLLAQALHKKKQYSQALQQYKKVIMQDNSNFDAHIAVGQILYEKNLLTQALQFFQTAVQLNTSNPKKRKQLANDLLQLGMKFFGQRDGENAAQAFQTILQINENYSSVHHNLAFTLAERLGRHHEAIKYYRKALALNPNNPEIHFCFALSCLATGNFQEGWQEYKARWKRQKKAPRKFIKTFENEWAGENLQNKTILLRSEQGFGDTLHFIRYAQLLKQQGAFVIAEVQKPLIEIISLCPYVDNVVAMGQQMPPFDYQIPLMNIPTVFDTTLETIPNHIPYLHANKQLEKKWANYLNTETESSPSLPTISSDSISLHVGLCWFGDAAHGQNKFMPLKELEPLLQMKGIKFYSLQKYTGIDQIEQLSPNANLHIFDDDFDKAHGSFMDSAALMKNLDLVITADTSVAHLAGALGVPVWIILPFPAEWRWLMDRNDSPWYPTARLFRQTVDGDWSDVQQELLMALQNKSKATKQI